MGSNLKSLKLILLSLLISSCSIYPYYESVVPLELSVFEILENSETVNIEIERTTKQGYATWHIPVPTKEFLNFFRGIPRNQQKGEWYGMSTIGQFEVSGQKYGLKVIHVKSVPSPSVLVVTETGSIRSDIYVINDEQQSIKFRKWLTDYLVAASNELAPYKIEAF